MRNVLLDKLADGLGPIIVSVKNADVILNKSSHKRILPEILL